MPRARCRVRDGADAALNYDLRGVLGRVLPRPLADRTLVHDALLVLGSGDVCRSLALGARIVREVMRRLPRAVHDVPLPRVVAICSLTSWLGNESSLFHRTVSPSRGSAIPRMRRIRYDRSRSPQMRAVRRGC